MGATDEVGVCFHEKMKIEHRFSFSFFYVQEKLKIDHQFSIFIFQFLKKMKIEHRFSFFIFQLSEKMNDPNIHALETLQERPVVSYKTYRVYFC